MHGIRKLTKSLLLIMVSLVMSFSIPVTADEGRPSFSLVSPVFLIGLSPLNSSAVIKAARWEHGVYAAEPQIVSFEERECQSPPERLYAWVEEGVTIIVWKSRATLICRYLVYRAEKNGGLSALNSIPLATTRFIDSSHADSERFTYHVEPVGADGRKGLLSGPALWREPEIALEVSD